MIRSKSYSRKTKKRSTISLLNKKPAVEIVEADDVWKTFRKWINDRGFKPHQLCIANFKETGRGLMATKTSNSLTIVQIPNSMLITPEMAKAHYKPSSKLSDQCLLALFLVHHASLNDNSPWKPYIDILPDSFSNACYIPDEILGLFPEEIQIRAEKQKSECKKEYDNLYKFVGHDLIPDKSLFKWAWFCVYTRCIFRNDKYNQKEIIIAPFLCCLNHSPDISMKAEMTPDGFRILSSHVFKKGEQVFINYGPHDDEFLFSEYGFVSKNNHYNYVLLDSVVTLLFLPIKSQLDQYGMYGDFTVSKNEFGYRIINAFRLLFCTNKSEIKTWIAIQKGINNMISNEIETKSLNNLINVCETKKTEYNLKFNKFKCKQQDYFVDVGMYILKDGIEILESVVDKCREELKSISLAE